MWLVDCSCNTTKCTCNLLQKHAIICHTQNLLSSLFAVSVASYLVQMEHSITIYLSICLSIYPSISPAVFRRRLTTIVLPAWSEGPNCTYCLWGNKTKAGFTEWIHQRLWYTDSYSRWFWWFNTAFDASCRYLQYNYVLLETESCNIILSIILSSLAPNGEEVTFSSLLSTQ